MKPTVLALLALGASLDRLAHAQSAEPLYVKMCRPAQTPPKHDDLQALLAESSLADGQVRRGLIEVLRQTENPCRKALDSWLTEMSRRASEPRTNTGRLAAVTLGVLLDSPAARVFIEAEAASGGGLEWLATLRQWDEPAFHALLQKWVSRSGERIRQERRLAALPVDVYGKNLIQDSSSGGLTQVLPPVVFDLHLKAMANKDADVEELAALNAVFVNYNSGARALYVPSFVPVLRRNAVAWMSVFRRESPWTQFQLLELMGRVGGAEMVRELMWLSQNHADVRMKSRASQALDEALKVR